MPRRTRHRPVHRRRIDKLYEGTVLTSTRAPVYPEVRRACANAKARYYGIAMDAASRLEPRLPPSNRWVIGFAVYASVAAILLVFFRWKLVEFLTPFLQPFLETAVALIFLTSVVCSIAHLVRRRKEFPISSYPLLVNLVAFLIVWFVPLGWIATRADFRLHYSQRMAVVADVLAGKYDVQGEPRTTTRGDMIALPSQLSGLSAGGGMIMRRQTPQRTLIFFFDFCGVLDSFSGFVYSSDDSPPQDADFNSSFFQIVRLQKNWYWASSRN
jgi:hypothetical protein